MVTKKVTKKTPNNQLQEKTVIQNPDVRVVQKAYDLDLKYSCIMISPGSKLSKAAEIRNKVINALNLFGYLGFSVDIDKSFDDSSIIVYIENQSKKILASARVTFRANNKLPFEKGNTTSLTHYDLKGTKYADINSFVFSSFKALPMLFSALGRLCEQNETKKCFCLCDEENKRIKSLYLKAGFQFSVKYSDPIFFPTFGRKINGKLIPTNWKIMEMPKKLIEEYSLEFSKYL
ncbi:MAG: hypothetical protein HQL32_12855 [Planctomycetes bacterium]|nr:hypothetical protein [Planctomycetota bacterium]